MKLNINLKLRQITLSLAIYSGVSMLACFGSISNAAPTGTETNSIQTTNINGSSALTNSLNSAIAIANANANANANQPSNNTVNTNSASANTNNSSSSINNGAINFVTNFTTQLDKASQAVSDTANGLVSTAFGFLGVPYKFGGTDTETGIDCSALVMLIYKESLGMVLPRTAAEQAKASQSIEEKDMKPGDLVFYNTMKRTFSHVGIYIGDGKFIHAPRTGAIVRVEEMDQTYWKKRFDGARRVIAQSPTIKAQ